MKKLLLMAMAVAAVLSGCTKENEPMEVGGGTTFIASTEGAPVTRATFDNTYKCASWEIGDRININGKIYNAQDAGTSSTFIAASGSAEGTTYEAYFPDNLYNDGSPALPSNVTETWSDGKFNMPMYAQSTNTDLEFKNLCGVLKVVIPNSWISGITSIMVSSANCATSGAFSINGEGAAVLSAPSALSNALTVNYTQPVETTAEGTAFYIAIPAQTYRDLKIKVSNGTQTRYMSTRSGVDIVVARNTIYTIPFAGNTLISGKEKVSEGATVTGDEVSWVQLWANGPRFATVNVGVTDGNETGFGGYYCWGSSVESDPEQACKDGASSLSGTDDTATNLWGSNWRMPTKDEFDGLFDESKCTITKIDDYNETGIKGILFTGLGVYSSNSLFLPAAGYFQGGSTNSYQNVTCYYWTSTPEDGLNSYELYYRLDEPGNGVQSNARGAGFSVRPVLASEPAAPEPEPAFVLIGGTKWATMNLGATTVAGSPATCYGDYYAWGDLAPRYNNISINKGTVTVGSWKDGYYWGYEYQTKDKTDYYGSYKKYLTRIYDKDDAVRNALGGTWRMPTEQEFSNLIDACKKDAGSEEITTSTPDGGIYILPADQTYLPEYTGVYGFLFVDKTDTSKRLFFPAAGRIVETEACNTGTDASYWSVSAFQLYYPNSYAYFLSISASAVYADGFTDRVYGLTIRPVKD